MAGLEAEVGDGLTQKQRPQHRIIGKMEALLTHKSRANQNEKPRPLPERIRKAEEQVFALDHLPAENA